MCLLVSFDWLIHSFLYIAVLLSHIFCCKFRLPFLVPMSWDLFLSCFNMHWLAFLFASGLIPTLAFASVFYSNSWIMRYSCISYHLLIVWSMYSLCFWYDSVFLLLQNPGTLVTNLAWFQCIFASNSLLVSFQAYILVCFLCVFP